MKNLYSEKLVMEALNRSGFLLEGKIGKYLRNSSWNVEHSWPFIDSNSDKEREIDLLATHTIVDPTGVMSLSVTIVGECKLKKNGIVIMGRNEKFFPSSTSIYYLSKGYPGSLRIDNQTVFPGDFLEASKNHPHFLVEKSGFQILGIDGTAPKEIKNLNSIKQDLLAPLNKATLDFIGQTYIFEEKSIDKMYWNFVAPIVIVSGPIWFYDTDLDETQTLNQIDSAVLSLNYRSNYDPQSNGLPIVVLSEDSADRYFDKLKEMLKSMIVQVSPRITEIRESVWREMSNEDQQRFTDRRKKES